jgi:uncharacterized membrane protein YjjP (DUF1212 family)
MKATGNLLGTILDLGKEMLIRGGEIWRVQEILEKLCESFLFESWDVWVVSSCIEATVQTWDGREYTQVRVINGRSYDLDKLDRLYALAEEVCEKNMGVNVIRERVDEIVQRPGLPVREEVIASLLGGVGFLFFFNGNIQDAFVITLAVLALVFFNKTVGKNVNNLLAYNTMAMFVMGILCLASIAAGVGHSLPSMVTAAVMMLAGGLGISNGIGDFLHGHTLSGLSETSDSLLGAVGIALGMMLAMIPFRGVLGTAMEAGYTSGIAANPYVSVISCTVGCMGFSLIFGARGRALMFSTLGSCLTWIFYLVFEDVTGSGFFLATMASSCFIAVFATVVNLFTGIPSAIFLTSCVFPLLPGSNLYYTVFGSIINDPKLFSTQSKTMLLIAAGIALGYITIDVMSKFIEIIRTTYFMK